MMKRSIFSALLVGLLLCVGCGPKGRSLQVEYVEGVITLDGQPIGEASVTFIPVNGGDGTETAGGYSDAQGAYKLTSMNGDPEKGAIAGEYRTIVSKIVVNDPTAGLSDEEAAKFSGVASTQTQLLHKIYQDRKNTPLSFTVTKGKNKIDIELLSKP